MPQSLNVTKPRDIDAHRQHCGGAGQRLLDRAMPLCSVDANLDESHRLSFISGAKSQTLHNADFAQRAQRGKNVIAFAGFPRAWPML